MATAVPDNLFQYILEMNKLNIPRDSKFSELSLEKFNVEKFSVHVLDFNWNYLFINEFVKQNLSLGKRSLVGKNMWEEFKVLAMDLFLYN